MSTVDLDAIRQRAHFYAKAGSYNWFHQADAAIKCAEDVPVLLAEVERLRAELAVNEGSEDARLAIAEREVERLRSADPSELIQRLGIIAVHTVDHRVYRPQDVSFAVATAGDGGG